MKVLVFSPYYPPHTGGLESHSEEFNRHLARQGVEIVVFTPRLPANAPEEESPCENIRIIRFPAYEIIPNYPLPKYIPLFLTPRFFRMFLALWKERPDIVISRTRFFNTSLLALTYAKSRGIPLVHIEHGSDFVRLSSPFSTFVAKIYDHTFGRIVFRCSDMNISISKAVERFVEKFDWRNSPVIYRGIDFDAIDAVPTDMSMQERYPGKIIMSTAARLYKWKGIENTIGAIRILPEDIRSKIIFLIVGDGEDFSHLKKLSKGLPIEMTGRLERTKVIATLKASDIYIHSSLPGGGLSTSLLEAMYCECAVIATPNEGADEIVEHDKNSILIGQPSAKEIGTAIERLIQDETKRKTFSAMAKRNVRERFSWDASIGKYLELFQTIRK
ncbi:MAG: glycosyltransferase family 4 protein [Candidatus Moranbacteria bacterium]|nr:glycosyltransferase family 4 protein [Candidatus Moranbacteria bacterium]